MSKSNLKPCPCCSGEAVIMEDFGDFQIICKTCRIQTESEGPYLAMKNWNTRIESERIVNLERENLGQSDLITRLQTALFDAILERRGVIPDSAEGLVRYEDLERVERERTGETYSDGEVFHHPVFKNQNDISR